MNAELLTAGLMIGGIGVITFYVVKSVLPIMPYLYPSTLLASRGSKTVTKAKLEALCEAKTLDEFVQGLSGTYFDIDAHNGQSHKHANTNSARSLINIHESSEEIFASLLGEISKHTPNDFDKVLRNLMLIDEVSVIKYLYKLKYLNKPISQTTFTKTISFSQSFYEKCAIVEFAEFKALFSQSMYWQVMKKEYASLGEFERDLDEVVYAKLAKDLPKKLADRKEISNLMKVMADKKNILACLQGMIRSQEPIYVSSGIQPKAKSLDELDSELSKTQYTEVFKQSYAKYAQTGYSAFEIAFEEYIYQYAKKLMYLKPQGAMSVLAQILRINIDKKNVQIISKGIDANLPSDDIKKMLLYV
jgi:vacuolar-type H+-ATPase subunit C/Vma6